MEEYIKEIEQIAARCTESQSDGYSQIMRICDAMREEQRYCLGYVSKGEIRRRTSCRKSVSGSDVGKKH